MIQCFIRDNDVIQQYKVNDMTQLLEDESGIYLTKKYQLLLISEH